MTSTAAPRLGSPAPVAFDVTGPLPSGVTVLEASAGTGKTYTIAALAARYVAEGHATLPELMLVTFGREATTELRERVRARLASTLRAVTRGAGDDPVDRLLADVAPAERARRRVRLARALAGFDAATIATTHQFCQQMLAGLGVAAGVDPDARFTESVEDLLVEVVDDFYVRKWGERAAGPPAFGRPEALTLARAAVHDGQARLEPADADPGSTADVRVRFAAAVRAEVERRKQRRGVYTYDDMVTRLDAALRRPGAAARLRDRYRVVLVDEFQDTDPVQWSILRRSFCDEPPGDPPGDPGARPALVLIGDPKQAIYAFRGADVVAYLEATRVAQHHATLGVNHRSDAPLLAALDTVFGRSALGDERIVVHPVRAAHAGHRLRDAPVGTPLRLRVVRRTGLEQAPRRDLAVVGPARAFVAADLAADVATLLASAATVDGEPVRPVDVAVLVRTNDQGALVRDALAAVGVPAVVTGTASVFGTAVAGEWLTLLEALERPRHTRLRAAGLTPFLGRTVAELAGPDADAVLDELGTRVRGWAALLHERGVAALLEAVTTDTDLPARLLRRTDGERLLTDLRHVGQALHAAAVEGHRGPAALVDWLRHRIQEAGPDGGADTVAERSRRLESDAAAVQIITIHRSKGLEFPVVYLPFGWDRNVRDPQVPLLHEGSARVRDVGGETGAGWKDSCAAHRAEEAGEDLRLLYVALTRARAQVVTWWVPATTTATSPVHRLFLGRPGPGCVPGQRYPVPTDERAASALRALASAELAVEEVPVGGAALRYTPPRPLADGLAAAVFDRELDRRWRRTSYTALTAGAGHGGPPGVASEPESAGTVDEPDLPVEPDVGVGAARRDGADPAPAADRSGTGSAGAGSPGTSTPGAGSPAGDPAATPSPMAALPTGAAFGTLVHAVLEVADLAAADLDGELRTRCADGLTMHPAPGLDAGALAAALRPVVLTPLGPVAGGRRLVDVARADRLAELEFELPLGGGDRAAAGGAALGDLAPVVRAHLAAADPLAGYADVLGSPALADQPLRGYLTGSIDAVLRLPGGRHVIVDYKTNWLGPVGPDGAEPLTAAHYTPDRLSAAMIGANYPLQALLYGVALHRFLRWRLPGYAPDRHLGGVLYLFVRGMCGPDTPTVGGTACGVFGWTPPPALTVALSELLHGSPP